MPALTECPEDPDATIMIKMIGGTDPPGATLAPKLGPLGVNAKVVGGALKEKTKAFEGIKVCCKVLIKNRQPWIELVPGAATLLLKELNEPLRDRKKEKDVKHDGDLKFQQVVNVAKIMRPRSMAKELSGTVREILGTCVSLGCTVDGLNPKEVTRQVKSGERLVEEDEDE